MNSKRQAAARNSRRQAAARWRDQVRASWWHWAGRVRAPQRKLEARLDGYLGAAEARVPALAWLRRHLALLVLAAAALLLMSLQSYNAALARPLPHWNHHSWVSAGNLAILAHSTPASGLVGYTTRHVDGPTPRYDYFSRIPFISQAAVYLLTMSYTDDLRLQVVANRQLLNLVLVACLALAFALVRQLLPVPSLALAACLFAFSGYHIMFYKDMVAPDLPTILGLLIALLAIARDLGGGRRRDLLLLSVLALVPGWSFSVLPTLGLYAVVDVSRMLWREGWRPLRWLTQLPRVGGVQATALATAVWLALMGYNLLVETRINQTNVARTGLVATALKRGGADAKFQKDNAKRLAWGAFAKDQERRLKNVLVPRPKLVPAKWTGVDKAVVGLMLLGLLVALLRWSWSQRALAVLTLLGGGVWVFAMRGLAAFHEYTAILYVGAALVGAAGALALLPRHLGPLALAGCLGLFAVRTLSINEVKAAESARVNGQLDELEAIRRLVKPGTSVFAEGGYDKIVFESPYALGFVLPESSLVSDAARADYVLSTRRDYNAHNLTRSHSTYFLFAP